MAKIAKDDKVTITDARIYKTYGIKPTDQFTVCAVAGRSFTLSNGMSFNESALLLVPQTSGVRTGVSATHLEDLVQNELLYNEDHDILFTVHDVTKSLRKENPGLNIDHNSVRSLVESTYENYDFTRTLANGLGNPEPWIYHKDWQYASDYGNSVQKPAVVSKSPNKVYKASYTFKS